MRIWGLVSRKKIGSYSNANDISVGATKQRASVIGVRYTSKLVERIEKVIRQAFGDDIDTHYITGESLPQRPKLRWWGGWWGGGGGGVVVEFKLFALCGWRAC